MTAKKTAKKTAQKPETWVKAFKGFKRDMTCRGFQYEEGKEYETERAEICEAGFHACENPLAVFGYYGPNESVFHKVEVGGDVCREKGGDKIAGTKIKIGARLDIAGLCKAAFEFVRARCINEKNAKKGEAATAGYRGAATAGSFGAATAGDSGAATAGSFGAATAGSFGAATSRGSVSVGKKGVGCVRGNGVKARGGLGAILMIAVENDYDYEIKEWKAIIIDGKTYKPDVFYTIKDGKIVLAAGGRR